MASDPEQTNRTRWRRDDGNTLLLAPAGVLILMVLGAIAVDFAIVFMAQREVADLAAGIANDAASAINEEVFYAGGPVQIDAERASTIVASVTANRPDDTVTATCGLIGVAGDEVTVRCDGQVEVIFSHAVPGVDSSWDVTSTSRAVAEQSS